MVNETAAISTFSMSLGMGMTGEWRTTQTTMSLSKEAWTLTMRTG